MKLDEQMAEMHKALEIQLMRIAQMQQQIDALRPKNDPKPGPLKRPRHPRAGADAPAS